MTTSQPLPTLRLPQPKPRAGVLPSVGVDAARSIADDRRGFSSTTITGFEKDVEMQSMMLAAVKAWFRKAGSDTLRHVLMGALVLAGALCSAPVHAAGRIVIVGDDYTVSDEYWNLPNNNVGTLIDNSLLWLGNGATAHSALVSSYFDTWLHHTNLYQHITSAGFAQTKSSTTTWNAQVLAGHDLVVASFSAGIDVQAMINYVNSGGNLLLVTGEVQNYQAVQTFASAFGIVITNSPNPNTANGPTGYATPLSNQQLTQGVSSLYFVGPAPMLLSGTNPDASLLFGFAFDSINYGLVATVGSVPEPASALLFAVGLVLLGRRARRRAS